MPAPAVGRTAGHRLSCCTRRRRCAASSCFSQAIQSSIPDLEFARSIESQFVTQGENEERSLVDTLSLVWELLSLLPPDELTRVREADLEKCHRRKQAAEA
ncbi:MAG: ATP synthase beta subunit C-terminal domain-containing protein [Acidiferrobacterales bacterium]